MRTLAATTLVLLAFAGAVRADVIYDTLWITDQQAYDYALGNASGGFGVSGYHTDARLVDDFVVSADEYPQGITLTRVAQDSLAFFGTPPREGFMVRVYADEGAVPADQPVLEVAVPLGDATITGFDDPFFDKIGMRFDLDVSSQQLELAPGTYWINIQPVDTTEQGDWYFQTWDHDILIGGDTHWRDDHFTFNWRSTWDLGYGTGTAAMRIEGVAIPAPTGLAVLAVGFVWRGRPRRRP